MRCFVAVDKKVVCNICFVQFASYVRNSATLYATMYLNIFRILRYLASIQFSAYSLYNLTDGLWLPGNGVFFSFLRIFVAGWGYV